MSTPSSPDENPRSTGTGTAETEAAAEKPAPEKPASEKPASEKPASEKTASEKTAAGTAEAEKSEAPTSAGGTSAGGTSAGGTNGAHTSDRPVTEKVASEKPATETAGTAAADTAGKSGPQGAGPASDAPTVVGLEGAPRRSGAPGPPPPWQRGAPASGPLPQQQPPAQQPPAQQPPSQQHPPSGPFPAPGRGARPAPPGGRAPESGSFPAAGRTGPPSGSMPAQAPARPAGGKAGAGKGAPGDRSGGSLIDAPTSQLTPEQLGMRDRGGRAGSAEDPADVADIGGRGARNKIPRRASLQVRRFDPWSVLKLALVLGVALFFVWMFAIGVLYAVLDGMGVWAQLNGTYQDLTSDSGGGGQLITAGGVFGVAAVIGVVNTILFTALASVSAFIYNISADVAGGIEVTLSERD